MRPLPFPPSNAVSFDEENAAWYVAFVAALCITITYLEATAQSPYCLQRSVLTGLCGIGILLALGWVVRRNLR